MASHLHMAVLPLLPCYVITLQTTQTSYRTAQYTHYHISLYHRQLIEMRANRLQADPLLHNHPVLIGNIGYYDLLCEANGSSPAVTRRISCQPPHQLLANQLSPLRAMKL